MPKRYTPDPKKGDKLSYQQAAVLAYRVLILAIENLDKTQITVANQVEYEYWESTMAHHHYELTLGYSDIVGATYSPIPSSIVSIYDIRNDQSFDVYIDLADCISKYHRTLIAIASGIENISEETINAVKYEYFNPDSGINPKE